MWTYRERAPYGSLGNDGIVVTYLNTSVRQMGIVVRLEGAELVGADLARTVATHQIVLEEEGDFGHPRATCFVASCGYLDGGDEVLLAIGAELTHGEL